MAISLSATIVASTTAWFSGRRREGREDEEIPVVGDPDERDPPGPAPREEAQGGEPTQDVTDQQRQTVWIDYGRRRWTRDEWRDWRILAEREEADLAAAVMRSLELQQEGGRQRVQPEVDEEDDLALLEVARELHGQEVEPSSRQA